MMKENSIFIIQPYNSFQIIKKSKGWMYNIELITICIVLWRAAGYSYFFSEAYFYGIIDKHCLSISIAVMRHHNHCMLGFVVSGWVGEGEQPGFNDRGSLPKHFW